MNELDNSLHQKFIVSVDDVEVCMCDIDMYVDLFGYKINVIRNFLAPC